MCKPVDPVNIVLVVLNKTLFITLYVTIRCSSYTLKFRIAPHDTGANIIFRSRTTLFGMTIAQFCLYGSCSRHFVGQRML